VIKSKSFHVHVDSTVEESVHISQCDIHYRN